MLCEQCGKNEATISQTDVVNNTKRTRHLCEACHAALGYGAPLAGDQVQASLPKAEKPHITFQLASSAGESVSDATCPTCGMTLAEFRKRGVVGCAEDYDHFREHLKGLLMRLHGARRHSGRMPRAVAAQLARSDQIARLQSDLEIAVATENYEEAATIRDRIEALRRSGESGHDE